MFKIIRCIFEVLISAVIMVFGFLLSIGSGSTVYSLLIIGISIFIFVLALKDSPKSKKTTNIKGSKRVAIIFLCILASAIIFIIGIMNSNDTEETTTIETTTAITETTSETEKTTTTTTEPTTTKQNEDEVSVTSKEDYKKSCSKIEYEKIARNPDKYKNENIMFKGEVVQCEKVFSTKYYARINVTLNEYGYYEDTVYVTFTIPEGEDKILDGDIVEIYGICQGEKTYLSIFGEQITIPSLDALYVELVK